MKNRALSLALLYSVLVIIYKLIIVLGGYGLSRFGFFFSNIVSVAAIVPFIIITIQLTKSDKGGYIGGKEALKTGLRMAVMAALIVSVYNYIEFEWKWRELSVQYYNSAEYKLFLAKNPQLKTEEYPKIIESAIAGLSPFKAVTAKLFVLIFFSVSAAFMGAVFLKKSPSPQAN